MYPSINKVKVKVLNAANVIANSSAISNAFVTALGKLSFLKASAAEYYSLLGAKLQSVVIVKSVNENPSKKLLSFTVAVDTEYGFFIRQDVPNKAAATGNSQEYVSVYFLAQPTAAQVATALKAKLDKLTSTGKLKLVSTVVGNDLAIEGAAGFPLFVVEAPTSAVTVADNQAAIAPNGTPGTAIDEAVAPHGTPATAIAGTATVTVTTLAAHGLLPGDLVDIASVATMTLTDSRTGTSGLAAVSDVVIASVPTSTTFTLQGISATGTNSGTITIAVKNKVRVTTNAAHGLAVGDKVLVTGIATMEVDGEAFVTGRVQSIPSTTTFWLDGVSNLSANSGTIVIKKVASESFGLGSQLSSLGVVDGFAADPIAPVDEIVAADKYTAIEFNYSKQKGVNGLSVPALGEQQEKLVVYVNEGATNYDAVVFRASQVAARKGWNSYNADPSL